MGIVGEFITNWIKELLVDGILSHLGGLFDTVNSLVGEIASQIGSTPQGWHPGVFSLIKNLSETVVLPIAGLILTFVATYEFIHLIVERNNLNEIDTWIFFKWIFKTFIAVLILSNTWNIVMAVFDVAQSVINSAGNLISGSTAVTPEIMASFEEELWLMGVGPLLGLWLQSLIIGFTMRALNICIFIIVYGRMIEIYILTSLAPIPFATLSSNEHNSMGQNYIKTLCAVAFQGLLILVCIGIYAVLIQTIATGGDPITNIWAAMGYTVLLAFCLFKTSSISKRIFHTN